MVFTVPKRTRPDLPFARFVEQDLTPEKGRELEWLLTNGIGGYSSTTILGLNTRKYHGLLVSSDDDLSRYVYLQKLEEEVVSGSNVRPLSVNEYEDRSVSDGWRELTAFEQNYESVTFHYNTWSADVSKTVSMVQGKNAVVVSYHVRNKMRESIKFNVNLLVNSRNIYELSKAGKSLYELKIFSPKILSLKSAKGYLTVYSDKASCSVSPLNAKWMKNVFYSTDYERGDDCVEDIHYPASFSINIPAAESDDFSIVALGYGTEEKAAEAIKDIQKGGAENGRIMGNGLASSILKLLASGDSFVVKAGGVETVIAGYHWFGEWGRDAMISLPGITFINGRFDKAEAVFSHFLDNAGPNGLPNRFIDGKPQYGDYDSSLWMIDRLYQYMKYVGPEKALPLLSRNWPKLKEMMKTYEGMEMDGLIMHKSGTWMDTLQRDSAVEVQALWYNALKIMQSFSEIVGDKRFSTEDLCKKFESSFHDRYWNGKYLKDCLGDNSIRPNQVIAVSLDHSALDASDSRKVLEFVREELLTPYGLRTLSTKDDRYKGQYKGNFAERESAYHNGTVWPWLLGPYLKACAKYDSDKGVMQKILEPLFEKHINEAGIGTISEIFDGDPPHRPRGCISQAWSVAEPLRAYYEDVMGKKPPYSTLFH